MLINHPESRNARSRTDAGRGPGELQILSQIRRRAAGPRSAALPVGIGDDCALLRPRRGEDIAVTTDLSLAGRHFRLDWHPPESVGHRTLARGLSDLASMGARPMAAFLSLGLPRELTGPAGPGAGTAKRSWLDRFLDGFLALARTDKTPLAGGDLAESSLATADIVLIGAVPRGRALLRSGARPGDTIYVTGALGRAAAGFACLAQLAAAVAGKKRRGGRRHGVAGGEFGAALSGDKLDPLLASHLYPQPRLAQGQWLMRRRVATAAIDISDGLSTDLGHLCDESEVAAEIDARALPLGAGASLEQALHGGEDYELLFTVRGAARLPGVIEGVPVTAIGRMVPARRGRPLAMLIAGGRSERFEARGWQHFI